MNEKLEQLQMLLTKMGNALIAYSGGVDSLFVAKVAHDCLQERVIALTAVSPSYPTYELEEAKNNAKKIGIHHLVVKTNELDNPQYRANQGDRCYHCKTELYDVCTAKAKELGIRTILNGTNLDDLGDYRPGLKAATEWEVRSPLVEVGMTKKEIREFSKFLGLPTWDKQALACLSSRFPPGTEVTEERLARIDRIESGLQQMGFKKFRVRFHEPIARIEVGEDDLQKVMIPEIRGKISALCHENGFLYASLDLDGYQVGSVNQILYPLKM